MATECDFGTAVLLVNQAALARIHEARTNPSRGKRTKIEVRAEDWDTVAKIIKEGSAKLGVTEETALAS